MSLHISLTDMCYVTYKYFVTATHMTVLQCVDKRRQLSYLHICLNRPVHYHPFKHGSGKYQERYMAQ